MYTLDEQEETIGLVQNTMNTLEIESDKKLLFSHVHTKTLKQ